MGAYDAVTQTARKTTYDAVRTSEMTQKMLSDDVWICSDCYADHHEGRAMTDSSVSWADNTDADETDAGIADFSSSACGCCGTTVAGYRFRMSIWSVD